MTVGAIRACLCEPAGEKPGSSFSKALLATWKGNPEQAPSPDHSQPAKLLRVCHARILLMEQVQFHSSNSSVVAGGTERLHTLLLNLTSCSAKLVGCQPPSGPSHRQTLDKLSVTVAEDPL